MDEKELNSRFQDFERQILSLQEQLRAVEQAIYDMSVISSGLEELKGKTGEEIMAQVGRGIFVKAKLVSEKILVDIGEGKLVEKTIDDTRDMILEQKEKIRKMQDELEGEMEKVNQEITKTMQEYQSNLSK